MIRFCCGVIAFLFFPAYSYHYWFVFVCLTLVFGLFSIRVKSLRSILPVLFGLAYSAGYACWGNAHLLPKVLERQPLVVIGNIDSIPQVKGGVCRFILSVHDVLSHAPSKQQYLGLNKPRNIQLNWYQCPEIVNKGEQWQFEVRLKQPHSMVNYGGFDFERLWFSQSIDARGYIKKGTLLQKQKGSSHTLWRSKLIEKLSLAEINPVAVPILKAILFGDKSGLTNSHWSVLRETGTIHLLIVSGLHIGLVSGFVLLTLLTILRVFPSLPLQQRRLFAVSVSIICAAGYAYLAGLTLPTQRALVMTILVLFSWLSAGQFNVLQRLGIAMALVLLLDPLSVLSAGFWLSFGATTMLLYMINSRLSRNRFLTVLKFQLGLFLFSLPLLAYWFYQVPLMSALFNVIAVPLVGFLLLPFSLIGMALLALFDSQRLLEFVAEIWAYSWNLLSAQAEVMGFQWSIPQPSIFAVLLALIGALWLLGPKAIPGKPLSFMLWLPLVFMTKEEMLRSEFHVKIFDVGQGLSVFIQTQHHNLLYDAGASFGDGFSVASMTVIPALKRRGITHIDKMIVSHGDNDHSGGVEHILKEFEVRDLVGGYKQASPCLSGQKWSWDEVVFEFLHPDAYVNYAPNNQSCVLKISSGSGSVLLTGDIESGIERMLVRQYKDHLRSDVVIVPHHGSQTSSTQHFVEAIDPLVAINSAGYLNRYNHPHPNVLSVYHRLGVGFLNTSASGQVNVVFGMTQPPEISEFRQENAAYWRR